MLKFAESFNLMTHFFAFCHPPKPPLKMITLSPALCRHQIQIGNAFKKDNKKMFPGLNQIKVYKGWVGGLKLDPYVLLSLVKRQASDWMSSLNTFYKNFYRYRPQKFVQYKTIYQNSLLTQFLMALQKISMTTCH